MDGSPYANPIIGCLERNLDSEDYAKFQQVLEFLGKQYYVPLSCYYNDNLQIQIARLAASEQVPLDVLERLFIPLKTRYLAFRFIKDVGRFIREKKDGDSMVDANFTTLLKILLFHALTSKTYTAYLALVEFEQLCIEQQITPETLYHRCRTKFLRLIIKAVLNQLGYDGANESVNGDQANLNGTEKLHGQARCNLAITYMFRALEVFNISTITGDDVAQSLIITTSLILKDKYNDAIKVFLKYLASFKNMDLYTLIRSHIQTIVVSMLIRRKLSSYDMTAALTKLCSFCDTTPREMLGTKYTFIKARLLLNYHIDSKSVTDSIYYLTKFELKEHEQPFEDEFDEVSHFIDYLHPSMIGILLGVDDHFTANRKNLGSDESIDHIKGLEKLLSLLTKAQVSGIHIKLLSTLNLLLRLRPMRDNLRLNLALRDLWNVFLSKLEPELKSSLLINICTALYDLVEDCPEEVAGIYKDLLCKPTQKDLSDQLKSLFFIPNVPSFTEVYAYLTPYVSRKNSFASLHEIQQALDGVLPLLKLENNKCRLIAISKIKQLLHTNQQLIVTSMLKNSDEPLDDFLTKTIESLIAVCCTQDPDTSALIAECLGILGAVNPIRMDHMIYGDLSCKNFFTFTNLNDHKFIIDLIERLKNSLFSDQRSESETATYALQVLVEKFSVLSCPKIHHELSEEATRACELCKNTEYSGTKKLTTDFSISVFERCKYDNNYSYKDWLDKFASTVISCIKDMRDKKIQEVLYACSFIFKYNVKLAEHLLSCIMIHIIIQPNTQSQSLILIKREIMAIVDEDVGVSTQDMNKVYMEDVRCNVQTLHFQCANLVFCALDAMQRLLSSSRGKDSQVKLLPKQSEALEKFTSSIPKDKLAILANKCRSHARALYYLDQHLFENKNQLENYATVLQRIYVALDDTYEASGIEMVRTSPTTIYDDIANYEACGKFDKAFICCESSLNTEESDIDNDSFVDHALRCLSSQGDHRRLYDKSKQLMTTYKNQRRKILPYAIEATWNLAKWGELEGMYKNEQLDNLLDSASVGQGYLLMSLNTSSKNTQEHLNVVRRSLIQPLSIAMMDRSAYFRGYQNFLVLHSIGDFASTLDMFDLEYQQPQVLDENTIDNLEVDYNKKIEALLELWTKRNNLVQPTLRSLEPLLVWQRAISQVLGKKYPILRNRISVDVGKMWLKSADSSREARSFDRSFYCLTEARKWFGSKFDGLSVDLRINYYMEQAKLCWDQGEQTKAIRSLKLAIERFKDHDLYKHLNKRREIAAFNDNFPKLNEQKACLDCLKCNQLERESFARLKMLLTQYYEEAAAGIPETLFFMYEDCVHLAVNQEETYLRLARYYDKLLAYYMENPTLCGVQAEDKNPFENTQRFSQNMMGGDKEEVYTKLMENSIYAFGHSLMYGVRYIRESMPRLLNIWYDLGSKKKRIHPTNSVEKAISSRIEATIRFIDDLIKKHKIPAYYFMTAISILSSRLCHPHSGVSKKTCEILEWLLSNYPHQIVWHLIAPLHDAENEGRSRTARSIIMSYKKNNLPKVEKIVKDTIEFAKCIQELCVNGSPSDSRPKKLKLGAEAAVKEVSPLAAKFNFNKATVMIPIEASMRAIIPLNNCCDSVDKHKVFPDQVSSYVRGFKTTLKVYNSLQRPKCVTFHCANGKDVNILLKAGDDLRKDSRCTEFLDLLNRILRRNNQSNARFFEIQTFLVLPLQSHSGMIEMVPNLEAMRHIHDTLYKERKSNFVINDIYPKSSKERSPKELQMLFVSNVLPRVSPAVLPTWFLRNFNEPTSWYMARLAFTRTTAVSSMGGYIIGLGDRHLDNILIDTRNGRLVHVDFNLLFHQGENLQVPERVPFRLTHNMVAAFGPLGTEGNFRKVCEIVMRVMRNERDSLLTTLKPFMHDPCSEWIKRRDDRMVDKEDKHAENTSAKFRIEVCERKLKGFPRSKKFKPLTLIDSYSVEAQVDSLIDEATDTFNLALMYMGWCPHI